MFASIQARYGVPPGPLLARSGVGSRAGGARGARTTSSLGGPSYGGRRSAYFTEHLYAALRRSIAARCRRARGVLRGRRPPAGSLLFPPKLLAAGTGNLEVAANALNSTANFLRAHGWRAGAGYQPGEPNFAAIQEWNAAGVYQKAIAIMGRQIDGGE